MDWEALPHTVRLSVPERLAVDLERLILEGRLAPGERLPPERELADRFAVSRVSVRDALREMEQRGLIDRRPGRGTIVVGAAERTSDAARMAAAVGALGSGLADMMELRAIVEPPIARLTAARRSDADVAQLEELLADMERAEAGPEYATLDRAFHQAIAEYTGNPLLALLTEHIAEQAAPVRGTPHQTPERLRVSRAAHRRIFNAIRDGDGAAAAAAAEAHIDDITRQLERSSRDDAQHSPAPHRRTR